MPRKFLNVGTALPLMLCMATSCGTTRQATAPDARVDHPPPPATRPVPDPVVIVVFYDGSDSDRWYQFAFREDDVVGESSEQPGIRNVRLYRARLPPQLRIDLSKWAEAQPNAAPPFPPPGPWFARDVFIKGRRREAFFAHDTPGLRDFLRRVRMQVARSENEVKVLPEWVLANEQLRRRLILD